jgi:hypothetical protein
MTKQEWVELFQAMNGRDPLPQEFLEAKKNGEFQTEILQPEYASPSVAEVSSSELVSSEIEQSAEPTLIDSAVIDSSESEQLVPDDSEVVAAAQLSTSTAEPVAEPSESAFVASPQPPAEDHLADLTEKAKGFASFAAEKAQIGAQFTAEKLKTGAQVTATYIKENQERQAQEKAEFQATGSYFDGSVLEYLVYSIGVGFLMMITLGIALPWAICIWERWYASHTVIGGRRLRFDGTAMQLFGNWIKWFIFIILTLGIYGLWVNVRIKQWVVKHTHFAN